MILFCIPNYYYTQYHEYVLKVELSTKNLYQTIYHANKSYTLTK